MNVQIDELQQDKFIRPIFQAMLNHLDDEQFIKIYFEVNLIEYSEYIPSHIMTNPSFIKEAIKRQLVDYSKVPDSFKNTDFITRDDYLNLIESRQIKINNGLYPQDKEIILKGLHGVDANLIEPQFKNDLSFIAECIKINSNSWQFFNKKSEFLKEKNLVEDVLSHSSEFFYQIPEEERKEKYILKAMLSNTKGYNLLNNSDILRTIIDPELVLDALKINPNIKVINQKFSTIIKTHDAKKDPYNFLKTYLTMNNLENKLDKKINQSKNIKI